MKKKQKYKIKQNEKSINWKKKQNHKEAKGNKLGKIIT